MLCTKENKSTYIHPSETCVVCFEEVIEPIRCKFCLSGAVCETCYNSMVEHHLENCPVCRKPEWNILLTEVSTEESLDSSVDESEESEESEEESESNSPRNRSTPMRYNHSRS